MAQLRGCKRGHLAGVIMRLPDDDLVVVLEEAALGRAGGARSVFVVSAAVAGAQEELGLREPAHRAAKMRAVDGEDLEVVAGDVANPAGNVAGLAVPGGGHGIAEVDEAGFAFGEIAERAEVDPGVFAGALFQRGAEEIADDRHGENCADRSIEKQRQLEEEDAARVAGTRSDFAAGSVGCLIAW